MTSKATGLRVIFGDIRYVPDANAAVSEARQGARRAPTAVPTSSWP